VSVPTIEYVDGIAQRENAKFRRYASINESFTDYQQFLSQSRYQKALSVSNDAALFVKELQVAGYATDPRYAEKIGRILQNEKLWSVE
jgi:peptidoglycan hydrolase FlgJ